MRIGETLKKAAGLFVEMPDQPATDMEAMESTPASTPMSTGPSTRRTVEEIVRESPGPNLEDIKVADASQVNPVTPAGTIDCSAIYSLANIPSTPFSAEQVLDLLDSLPKDLPIDNKRSMVKITLGAMTKTLGVTSETIVADASRKLAALAAYSESYTKQASDYILKSEADIINLQKQIEDRKKMIEQAKSRQASVTEGCHQQSDRLDDVLEFFSMDVPPSKYAGKSKS